MSLISKGDDEGSWGDPWNVLDPDSHLKIGVSAPEEPEVESGIHQPKSISTYSGLPVAVAQWPLTLVG